MLSKKDKKELRSIFEYASKLAETDEERARLAYELPYILGEATNSDFDGAESQLSAIFEKYGDLDKVPRAIKKNYYYNLLTERYRNMINFYEDWDFKLDLAIRYFFGIDKLTEAQRVTEIKDEMSLALEYKIKSDRFIELAHEVTELIEGTPLEEAFERSMDVDSDEYRRDIEETDFTNLGGLKGKLLELVEAYDLYKEKQGWGYNIVRGTLHKEIDRLALDGRMSNIDPLDYQMLDDSPEEDESLYLGEARDGALKLADTLKTASRKMLKDPKADREMTARFSSLLEEITELGLKESATIIELADVAQRIENFLDAPFG